MTWDLSPKSSDSFITAYLSPWISAYVALDPSFEIPYFRKGGFPALGRVADVVVEAPP